MTHENENQTATDSSDQHDKDTPAETAAVEPVAAAENGNGATDEAAENGNGATDEAAENGNGATDEAAENGNGATDEAAELAPVLTALKEGEEETVEGAIKVEDTEVAAVLDFVEYIDFETLKLEPRLLQKVFEIGWQVPTPIQKLCLPITLKGKDAAGFAQTGTGKTGVFLITLAHQLLSKETRSRVNEKGAGTPYCVVMVPTRELAIQITADSNQLLGGLGIEAMAVYGGDDYDPQIRMIKKGVDLIIATPGRLKDFIQKEIVTLSQTAVFVCDEADRMFDMGFIDDIEFFFQQLAPEAQKLLFSATTNEKVKELAFEYLENPHYLSANPEEITPHNVEQSAIICEAVQKVKIMLGLLRRDTPTCAIIFTNTKMVAEWLYYKLFHNGIDVEVITGDLPQRKRIALISRIKKGELKVLIATDVASRGLHIASVSHVYNFDLPDEPANYIHRIGRTARAGAAGKAVSLVCEDYGQNLAAIRALLGENISIPTEWYDEEFMKIEDLSGNPFDDPKFAASQAKPSFRDRDGGGRRDSRGPSRGGRDKDYDPRRGGERDRDREKRGGKAPYAEKGERKDFRGERGGAKGGRGDGRDKGRYGGRERDRDRDQKQYAKGGHYKHGKKFQKEGQFQPKTRKEATQPAKKISTPSTIMGMLRKIFSVIFGFGRKKKD
jgi:ATP-dependent RNA helicase RhlB